jgi:hypothetical protein
MNPDENVDSMVSPFRLRNPNAGAVKVSTTAGDKMAFYLERLTKMIPGEIVGLYLLGAGFIEGKPAIWIAGWSAFCLLCLLAVRIRYTADPAQSKGPQWIPVVISAVAFVIWLYALGGPFAAYKIDEPALGSLLVLGWSFIVPILYKGPTDA